MLDPLGISVSQCVDSISNWMHSNRLQLNADKTDLMWWSSIRKLLQLPSCSFSVAGSLICTVSAVRDLGVFIDNDLGVATHVRRTMSCCFTALRQLHRYVTDDCFHSLVVSLVHSRLDYGNFILAGLPAYQQRCLQSTLNTATRVVFRLGRHNHVSDAFATLHWLRLPQCVDFKLAVLVSCAARSHATIPGRSCLCCQPAWSSSTSLVFITPTAYSIIPAHNVNWRTFPVAASFLWNLLPSDI